MEKLNAKVWIPAIVLMTALVTAIVVTLLLQGRLYQLNKDVSDLNKLIAAEKQSKSEALTQNDAAQSENQALRAENDSLITENNALYTENKNLNTDIETLRQYQLSFDVPNGFVIVIDQRLDPKLVEMIEKHFNAMANGNIDAYRDTLANNSNDYLIEIYNNHIYTKTDITSITTDLGTQDSRLQNGGFYITVSFRKDGQINFHDIGVTKNNGRWVVYDYD